MESKKIMNTYYSFQEIPYGLKAVSNYVDISANLNDAIR